MNWRGDIVSSTSIWETDHLEDGEHPAQGADRLGRVARLEARLQVAGLVEELLEPQLVHLVDDDEQHLVVLVGPWALGAEDLVEGQVRRR